uniref:Uncharacterized protein n=1 Tax=Kuenenia stuttgartiensis TaxID=174633 RepID=Q1PV83_KUEST|nr:unknown protein [Candidatus Kuenenia stuttgartiensis]
MHYSILPVNGFIILPCKNLFFCKFFFVLLSINFLFLMLVFQNAYSCGACRSNSKALISRDARPCVSTFLVATFCCAMYLQ